MAIFYTWTPVSKEGKLFSGNKGLFTSQQEALDWAGFTEDQETESGSYTYQSNGSICERLRDKYVNYYLNLIVS